MRFATRMLVVQVATQVAVVAVCTAVFAGLGVQQLKAEADSSALNIARSVAESPQVRELVAEFSADPGTPDATTLRDGVLQRYAADVTDRTEGLFVVITDDHGIRLAHPDPDRLGQVALRAVSAGGEGEQHLPDRGRTTRGHQHVVERAVQRLGRAADEQAQGIVRRAHAVIIDVETLDI